jgi:hypothetical protein
VLLLFASEIGEHCLIASEESFASALDARLEVIFVALKILGDSAINELTLGAGKDGRT